MVVFHGISWCLSQPGNDIHSLLWLKDPPFLMWNSTISTGSFSLQLWQLPEGSQVAGHSFQHHPVRAWYRNVLMVGFHFAVWLLASTSEYLRYPQDSDRALWQGISWLSFFVVLRGGWQRERYPVWLQALQSQCPTSPVESEMMEMPWKKRIEIPRFCIFPGAFHIYIYINHGKPMVFVLWSIVIHICSDFHSNFPMDGTNS